MQEYKENPHASAWVMAHAGSGKTYALVRRVIALLMAGADARTIWCVTYTNIAAAEMLARTIEMLETLNQFDDARLQAELEKYLEMPATPESVVQLRAIYLRLQQPGQRMICTTMHGLCQHILRIFALELGISPSFTALEAEAQRSLMQRACDQLFSQAMQPTHPAAAALDYVSRRIGSYAYVVEHVRAMMDKRGAMQHALFALGSYEAVRDAIFTACGARANDTDEILLQQAHAATPPEMRQVAGVLRSGSKKDIETAAKIEAWLDGSVAAWEAYLDVFVNRTDERKPTAKLCTKILTPDMPLGALLYREQGRIVALRDMLANLACAQDSAHLATLFYGAFEIYQELKAQAEALDFDDMIFFVQRLLSDPQSLGYVMSKLDYRVEHILVDEAQDTSPAQWQILSTLIEDLCAAAGATEKGPPRSAFVVGDTKQSIYSFQGAAPWMMQRQRDHYAALFAGHGKPFHVGTITHARRSVPKILQFVDAVGDHPAVRSGWMEAAEPHVPTRSGSGYIALWPVVTHDDKTARTPYEIPTRYSLGTRAPRKLAEQIAGTIRSWIDEKRPLSSSGAPVTAGDVMIIVRRRGTLVPALIRALELRGVSVAGMDRVKLSEHVFVRDFLALIRWCFQHDDDVSLAEILRSPIGGLSEDALFTLAHDRSGSLWTALRASTQYVPLAGMLQAMTAMRNQPVYHLLTQLLYAYGMLTRYRARLGNEVQEIIDEVLHYAAALEGTHDALPLHFLMRMNSSQAEVKRENAPGDYVRILTVHGAKGLESPIVILADMAEMPSTGKDRLFAQTSGDITLYLAAYSDDAKLAPCLVRAKQAKKAALDAEYYRELYVALTRARDELYLCTAASKSLPEESWYALCDAVLRAQPEATTDENSAVIWADTPAALRMLTVDGAKTTHAALPAWLRQLAAMQVAPRVLTPSGVGMHAPYEAADMIARESTEADARDYGTVLHGVLEWAGKNTPIATIEAALTRSGLPARDVARMLQSLQRLWNDEAICRLLSLPSQREQALSAMLPLADTLHPVYGIIDRLIVTDSEVMVLDYKTALMPPPIDALPEHYTAQMALYRAVLMRIYPQHTVRCALLWTHTPRLDWLSEQAMERALDALTNNLGEEMAASLDVSGRAA